MDSNKTNRREVIKALGAVPIVASIGTALLGTGVARAADSTGTATARIGVIGVGSRGTSLLKTLLRSGECNHSRSGGHRRRAHRAGGGADEGAPREQHLHSTRMGRRTFVGWLHARIWTR